MRYRMADEPRQYRFHSIFFRRLSSNVASFPKNWSRSIRLIGTAARVALGADLAPEGPVGGGISSALRP